VKRDDLSRSSKLVLEKDKTQQQQTTGGDNGAPITFNPPPPPQPRSYQQECLNLLSAPLISEIHKRRRNRRPRSIDVSDRRVVVDGVTREELVSGESQNALLERAHETTFFSS
jgi:hypothetical protein